MTAFTEAFKGLTIEGPDLEEGEVITDAIVLTRVMRPDMTSSVSLRHVTKHTDAIVQLGMISAARLLMESGYVVVSEDE